MHVEVTYRLDAYRSHFLMLLTARLGTLRMATENEHKYIIIGGGTAGCVLANRLTTEKVRASLHAHVL